MQLQDSWRESRAEVQEARQDVQRLQHLCRERDRFWRDLWENRRSGPAPDADDIVSSSPSFSPLHAHPNTLGTQMSSAQLAAYGLDGMNYRSADGTPVSQTTYNGQQDYSQTSSNTLAFSEGDVSGDGSHCLSQRVDKVKCCFPISGSIGRAGSYLLLDTQQKCLSM